MCLFTFERCVAVQQLLTGVFGGLGRVVVRLQRHERQHGWTCPQPSPSLCVDDRGAGKRFVLVSGDDEDEGEAHPHLSQPLLYQLSNTATVVESTSECKCFQLETAIVFHFPMERFFTRRAGPPVTAWQERHAEEDFFALVRHNAATKLEIHSGHLPRRRGASGSRARTSRVHTGLVRLGGRARGAPTGPPASEAARLVAPRHVAIRWKQCTDRRRQG